MIVFKQTDFGPVKGFKLGWAPVGNPMMCTHCFTAAETMIDSGQAHMQEAALEIAAGNNITQMILTHHHEDHTGNAAAVKQKRAIPVYGHPLTAAKMAKPFNIFPYQKYVWGKSSPLKIDIVPEQVETGLGSLIPVHTPGHSKDHTVYLLKEEGILFSGDAYLGDRIRFFRADEEIGDQIRSLKKISCLDFDLLLCSHNPRSANGPAHIRQKLDFLENFYGQIAGFWQQGMKNREILKAMHLKESLFVKYFCFGNVSMINGIRSVTRELKPETHIAHPAEEA